MELAARLSILTQRAERIINQFGLKKDKVIELVQQSFLDDELKRMYLTNVEDRLRRIDG